MGLKDLLTKLKILKPNVQEVDPLQDAFRELKELEENEKSIPSIDTPEESLEIRVSVQVSELMDKKEYNSPQIKDEDMFYKMVRDEIVKRAFNSLSFLGEDIAKLSPDQQKVWFDYVEVSNAVVHNTKLSLPPKEIYGEEGTVGYEDVIWGSIQRNLCSKYKHKTQTLESIPGIVYQWTIRNVLEEPEVQKMVRAYWNKK